ncbi:MAG: tetratricopeptide repeat protein [Polyangiaceae bacterium]|nr:tetratricopeptide repeat protein [Polyangiaceae bacterium]
MKGSSSDIERGCALFARAQELRDAGNPIQARALCKRALSLLENALGPRHPDVANVLLEIAGTFEDCGESAMAIEPCERAAAILARVRCGIEGELLKFASLSLLGRLYVAAGRYREAKKSCTRALHVAEQKLGHAERCDAHNGLGVVHRHLGKLDIAEAHYRQSLALLGRPRPPQAMATLYHNLAGLEHARGQHARGIVLARRGLRLREKALGPAHVSVAADKAALASLYEGKGDLAAAATLYHEAIAIFRKAYGPKHFEVGFNLGNLAAILHEQGRLSEASKMYRRALAIQEEAAGASHPFLALLLENFASLRLAKNRPVEAAALQDRAIAIYSRALGSRHPDTLAARKTRRDIMRCVERSTW